MKVEEMFETRVGSFIVAIKLKLFIKQTSSDKSLLSERTLKLPKIIKLFRVSVKPFRKSSKLLRKISKFADKTYNN